MRMKNKELRGCGEPVRLLKNSKNSPFEVPDPLICSQMELRQNGPPRYTSYKCQLWSF